MKTHRLLLAMLCTGGLTLGASTASAAVIDFDMNLDATDDYSGTVDNVRRIQFDLNTQTFQYVADPGNPVQAGDTFVDRGYGDATSYRTAAGGAAPQSGTSFLGGNYSMGLIWEELNGVITGTNDVGGNWVVNARYTGTSGGNFQLYMADLSPGFGQDYDGAQAHYEDGQLVMELSLNSGNSILEFTEQGGDFVEGTFTFEFQVDYALEGLFFTQEGDDFADLIEDGEGNPTFMVSANASAGTIQEPAPETFFGDDANSDVFGETRNDQSLFSETQSTHDGSLRFAVPEPGSLALMGTALLLMASFVGAGNLRRRNQGNAGMDLAAA
ncbi:PEP-CTERM sorting domain-containing protein [Ectothiorhodospira mobilis]|nr:PEP-CTERM sorting domain-containing protein [Ectothiorhodospira mobilis]MCG5535469.1 PEP-CTERM sorting domain-containing protein [Ectothiorhodospira mobilis]